MDNLKISEYVDVGCLHCREAMDYAFYTVKIKGRNVKVLRLGTKEQFVIIPDYNSAGHLTHFHVEVQDRNGKNIVG